MYFNSFEKQYPLRVDELKLIIRAIKLDWLNRGSKSNLTYMSNFYEWTKELLDLIGEEEYAAFMFEAITQHSNISTCQNRNTFVDELNYKELLTTIEQYQNSPPPLQNRNFGSQVYYYHYLSNRIELIYKIGTLANILSKVQVFDNQTKVTQETQNVCDLVIQWVENKFQIKLLQVNVYEPFIFDYYQHSYLRAEKLREIGVRAGLLEENIEVGDESRISLTDAKTVINWLKETYEINLPFPQSHQLHPNTNFPSISENSIERRVKNDVAKAIGVTILFVLLLAACSQFYSFVNSNQQEYELRPKNHKPTAHSKAKAPITKNSN